MRACWLKWVGRDWSISADYIWLNYSDANSVPPGNDRLRQLPRKLHSRCHEVREGQRLPVPFL